MTKKGQQNLITGLDIGSTKIRMVVGQLVTRGNNNDHPELQILGAAEVDAEGISKGTISSIEDTVSSVSACLERIERMVGVPIESAWVGVSGLHVLSQVSKGFISVSKADNEISAEDVTRAIESARAISTPLNYDILHVLPKSYAVDGQTGIKDPVGMTGFRLEVDCQIILGAIAQIKNLTKAVYRAGLEIDDLVLSILATAETVVTHRQKELGVAVVNLGGPTTSLAIFEEGDILHTAILPLGSENITKDLSIGLRTSFDIAERVKTNYGSCLSEMVDKHGEVDLFELGAIDHELYKQKYISEIIEARTEEILQKIDNELRKAERSGLLPAGVVFTGGGAKMPGLAELAKKQLRLPATIGYPLDILSATEKVNDPGFAPAVGLVKWGSKMYDVGHHGPSAGFVGGMRRVSAASGQVKKWLKSLIP